MMFDYRIPKIRPSKKSYPIQIGTWVAQYALKFRLIISGFSHQSKSGHLQRPATREILHLCAHLDSMPNSMERWSAQYAALLQGACRLGRTA